MTLTMAPPGTDPGTLPARRYYLKTVGCQMNVADSAGFADVLEGRGFEPTGDPADADLAVVNTCTVREKAEEKHREHGSSAAEPGREFEADAPLLTSYPDRCR